MNNNEKRLKALRDAIALSPDDFPLRKKLSDALMDLARYPEAIQELRLALARAPDDTRIKLALATAFSHDKKDSMALVIIEDLLKVENIPLGIYLLHACVLARAGELDFAVSQYRKAIAIDPTLARRSIEDSLGIRPD